MAVACAMVCGAQINTDQVLRIGQNSLFFEDYVLSIQYFNQVIKVKPYLAKPYFFRSVAKLNLGDYKGAEDDATLCIARNPEAILCVVPCAISRAYHSISGTVLAGLYVKYDQRHVNTRA